MFQKPNDNTKTSTTNGKRLFLICLPRQDLRMFMVTVAEMGPLGELPKT